MRIIGGKRFPVERVRDIIPENRYFPQERIGFFLDKNSQHVVYTFSSVTKISTERIISTLEFHAK